VQQLLELVQQLLEPVQQRRQQVLQPVQQLLELVPQLLEPVQLVLPVPVPLLLFYRMRSGPGREPAQTKPDSFYS
jgi:hypothetical protein